MYLQLKRKLVPEGHFLLSHDWCHYCKSCHCISIFIPPPPSATGAQKLLYVSESQRTFNRKKVRSTQHNLNQTIHPPKPEQDFGANKNQMDGQINAQVIFLESWPSKQVHGQITSPKCCVKIPSSVVKGTHQDVTDETQASP